MAQWSKKQTDLMSARASSVRFSQGKKWNRMEVFRAHSIAKFSFETGEIPTHWTARNALPPLSDLVDWPCDGISPKLYFPHPISYEITLFCLLTFRHKCEFTWRKPKRNNVLKLNSRPNLRHKLIATQMGCSVDDLDAFSEERDADDANV
jgi:hypothetical protein